MGADYKIAFLGQLQTLKYIRGINLRTVMVQYLKHGAAGLDDLVGRQALAQQVVPGNGAVGQVDVCRVVHDAAVDLFGHPHIKAAVAGLHVEYGHLAPLGRNHAQAAVGVAQHQHGLGLFGQQQTIHLGDDGTNGFCCTAHGGI